MSRTFACWALLGLFAAGTGCRICANPHDYCGPVVEPGGIAPYGFCDRRGSNLGGGQMVDEGVILPEGAIQAAGEPELGPVPEARRAVPSRPASRRR